MIHSLGNNFNPDAFLSNVSQRQHLSGVAIKKDFELQIVTRVLYLKSLNLKAKMSELCKEVGISESSFNRLRRDVDMPPLFRYIKQQIRSKIKTNSNTNDAAVSPKAGQKTFNPVDTDSDLHHLFSCSLCCPFSLQNLVERKVQGTSDI
jgi:AraC-like DNA-binding protein